MVRETGVEPARPLQAAASKAAASASSATPAGLLVFFAGGITIPGPAAALQMEGRGLDDAFHGSAGSLRATFGMVLERLVLDRLLNFEDRSTLGALIQVS